MSEISKQALKVDNSTSFPNNTTGYISPTILRAFNVNMIDSLVDEIGYTADSASWNISIGQLNGYTASFAPSLTQLNAFTASQLTINTGYNTFTQSANQELDSLSAWTGSWNLWTSSINEIRDDGVLQGYSTRFYFNGLVSASVVQNVNGPIANVTIQQDGTKLNTSSFNDYTASTAATQSLFSASVATSISQSSNGFNQFSQSQNSFNLSATASIVELLNLSSSLSGGYATQGELDQSASVLQANINQKLFTSSFNAYTSSNDTRTNTLSSFTGSYATTGSNQFIGNQIITGSVTISGSATSDLTVVGQIYVSSSATGGTTQPRIIVSGSSGQTTIQRNSVNTNNGTNSAGLNPLAIFNSVISTQDEIGFAVNAVGGGISGWPTGSALYVNNTAGDTYPAVFGFQNKATYTDGRVTVLTPLVAQSGSTITGSTTITGSLTITGSTYGNVISTSMSAQTASIDLSSANYFSLTITGSTRINVINPRPGNTAILRITTTPTSSVTFSSNVLQPTGSIYSPTIGSNTDILTLTAFDTGSVYVIAANQFS